MSERCPSPPPEATGAPERRDQLGPSFDTSARIVVSLISEENSKALLSKLSSGFRLEDADSSAITDMVANNYKGSELVRKRSGEIRRDLWENDDRHKAAAQEKSLEAQLLLSTDASEAYIKAAEKYLAFRDRLNLIIGNNNLLNNFLSKCVGEAQMKELQSRLDESRNPEDRKIRVMRVLQNNSQKLGAVDYIAHLAIEGPVDGWLAHQIADFISYKSNNNAEVYSQFLINDGMKSPVAILAQAFLGSSSGGAEILRSQVDLILEQRRDSQNFVATVNGAINRPVDSDNLPRIQAIADYMEVEVDQNHVNDIRRSATRIGKMLNKVNEIGGEIFDRATTEGLQANRQELQNAIARARRMNAKLPNDSQINLGEAQSILGNVNASKQEINDVVDKLHRQGERIINNKRDKLLRRAKAIKTTYEQRVQEMPWLHKSAAGRQIEYSVKSLTDQNNWLGYDQEQMLDNLAISERNLSETFAWLELLSTNEVAKKMKSAEKLLVSPHGVPSLLARFIRRLRSPMDARLQSLQAKLEDIKNVVNGEDFNVLKNSLTDLVGELDVLVSRLQPTQIQEETSEPKNEAAAISDHRLMMELMKESVDRMISEPDKLRAGLVMNSLRGFAQRLKELKSQSGEEQIKGYKSLQEDLQDLRQRCESQGFGSAQLNTQPVVVKEMSNSDLFDKLSEIVKVALEKSKK